MISRDWTNSPGVACSFYKKPLRQVGLRSSGARGRIPLGCVIVTQVLLYWARTQRHSPQIRTRAAQAIYLPNPPPHPTKNILIIMRRSTSTSTRLWAHDRLQLRNPDASALVAQAQSRVDPQSIFPRILTLILLLHRLLTSARMVLCSPAQAASHLQSIDNSLYESITFSLTFYAPSSLVVKSFLSSADWAPAQTGENGKPMTPN